MKEAGRETAPPTTGTFTAQGGKMDSRLQRAKEGLATLTTEVQGGAFLEKIAPDTTKIWKYNGLVFAADVPDPENGPNGQEPSPFTIITPYAGEAGALLESIQRYFSPLLDDCIEHDIFDRLGEAALEYSGFVNREDARAVNLLKVIMSEAEDILDEMIAGETPYTAGEES